MEEEKKRDTGQEFAGMQEIDGIAKSKNARKDD